MKKLHGLGILMGAVLLAIAGFQVYWIRDNYSREQKAVEVRAQALFRETVREVQDAVLQKKLKLVLKDTTLNGLKKAPVDGHIRMRASAPRTARVLHMLSEQLEVDSANRKKGVFIRVDNGKLPTGARVIPDSIKTTMFDEVVVMGATATERKAGQGSMNGQQVWEKSRAVKDTLREKNAEVSMIYFNTRQGDNFKISIDSLFKDSLSVNDLDTAYSKKLQEQKLDIPFRILRQPHESIEKEYDPIRRPFSFESFEGYKLELGNAFSYLIKKISLPILFSVFLVGLSILSFVLLYRNLLRQHRLAEMKNDLISNITHELKTPIATVGVAIEALKNFNAIQDTRKTKEYLDISQNELQRLGLLVDKVLKLSMFENDSIEIKKEMLNLEDVMNDVVHSLKLQAEKSKASIRVNAEGSLLVNGDRLHLVSVVFNLLDNALKYNKGSVDIQVNLKEGPENIILNVVDNGIGIPYQYKHKIFEKFFRVPSGNTHNAKGHGLGLSYVAQVVRQHQGSISVDSQEGSGSSFTILLPKPANPQNTQV